jgi:HSP20 family protein
MAEPNAAVPVKSERGTELSPPRRWDPFSDLRDEVDRIFNQFNIGWPATFRRPVPDFGAARPGNGWALAPAVDVAEKEKEYEITAELPGLDEKDIDVKVANGVLTIKGEKKEEKEERQKDYYLSERRYGAFHRSFTLPDGVDADQIAATFSKGVLTVKLPKTAQAQSNEKKISIKAS